MTANLRRLKLRCEWRAELINAKLTGRPLITWPAFMEMNKGGNNLNLEDFNIGDRVIVRSDSPLTTGMTGTIYEKDEEFIRVNWDTSYRKYQTDGGYYPYHFDKTYFPVIDDVNSSNTIGTGSETTVPSTKEKDMSENAVYHMEQDARKAYQAKSNAIRERTFMDCIEPKSMEELQSLFDGRHYEPVSETDFKEIYDFGSPIRGFRFRKHSADKKAHDEGMKRLDERYAAVKTDIRVLGEKFPEKALESLRVFQSTTIH